jgi:cysteine desulfuration protein SufE
MTFYPSHPFGTQIRENDLLQEAKKITSWEDKYRFIIQLGKKLPAFSNEQKSCAIQIKECESKVWLQAELIDDKLHLYADSDARIVKGLLALLLVISHHKSKKDIQEIDFAAYFDELGLLAHLSESRNNGLQSVIKKIIAIAN